MKLTELQVGYFWWHQGSSGETERHRQEGLWKRSQEAWATHTQCECHAQLGVFFHPGEVHLTLPPRNDTHTVVGVDLFCFMLHSQHSITVVLVL